MKKTLCQLKLSNGLRFYLIQNDQNNLVVSANCIGVPPVNNVVILDPYNKCADNFGNKFLSGEIFKVPNVAVIFNATNYHSLKDLLKEGLKIPQHQMPNLPVGHGPQMHNIVPVFNPQNQQNNNISENVKVQHNNGQQNFYYSPQESVYGSVHNHLNNYINTDCKIF